MYVPEPTTERKYQMQIRIDYETLTYSLGQCVWPPFVILTFTRRRGLHFVIYDGTLNLHRHLLDPWVEKDIKTQYNHHWLIV